MATVTEEKVDQLLRERLRERGVLEQVGEIDLFPTPEGVLAELILLDASTLEVVREAVQEVEGKLAKEGVSLLPTLRALWAVDGVEKIQTSNPPGVPSELLGVLFKGTLKSGQRPQEVWVAVTPSALRVLRPLAPTDGTLIELVRSFLMHRLSIGGAGYWDPIREPRQELDESAARYLRWRPYEALKASVDEIFNPGVGKTKESIRRFAKLMNSGSRSIYNLQQALTDLPGPGGAFSRGEWLPRSNYEFYNMLLEPEKRQLESYYLDQVAKGERDFPGLKGEFPAAFKRG